MRQLKPIGLLLVAAGLLGSAVALGQDQSPVNAPPGVVIKLGWQDPVPAIRNLRFDSTAGEVRLKSAAITNYSVALVPCEEMSGRSRGRNVFQALVGIGTAHAGHGGTPSPLQLVHSAAETLGVGGTWTVGTINLPDTEYCGAHYLVVRAFSGSRAIDTHPEVRGLSLSVSGTVRNREGEPVEFRIATPEAFGLVVPLTTPEGKKFHGPLPTGSTITLVRDYRFIFKGIDVTKRNATTARQILRNLMENTIARVELGG